MHSRAPFQSKTLQFEYSAESKGSDCFITKRKSNLTHPCHHQPLSCGSCWVLWVSVIISLQDSVQNQGAKFSRSCVGSIESLFRKIYIAPPEVRDRRKQHSAETCLWRISGVQPICLGFARAGRGGGNVRTWETPVASCDRNKSEEAAHEGLIRGRGR